MSWSAHFATSLHAQSQEIGESKVTPAWISVCKGCHGSMTFLSLSPGPALTAPRLSVEIRKPFQAHGLGIFADWYQCFIRAINITPAMKTASSRRERE